MALERLHCFAFNIVGTLVEVVDVPTIYMRGPFLPLKRRKKGPAIDQREKLQPQPTEL